MDLTERGHTAAQYRRGKVINSPHVSSWGGRLLYYTPSVELVVCWTIRKSSLFSFRILGWPKSRNGKL